MSPGPGESGEDEVKRAQKRTVWSLKGGALALAAALALLAAPFGTAVAETTVYFEPGVAMADLGESFDMSFRVAASPDSVASFQLYLWFDPDVVELTDAVEGTLYVESGTMTWFIAEEEYPGFWHFFDTVFGAGTHVLPPGELLHLSFTALAVGQTPARIDTIRMTDIRRDPLPVTDATDGWIFVGSVGVPEETTIAPSLDAISPNPFTSGTTIDFSVPAGPGEWRIEIFDVAGRKVRTLDAARGLGAAGGAGRVAWDGRTDSGGELPSSVYFVRLTDGRQETRSRVLKLK
jgi:hypothetical protein